MEEKEETTVKKRGRKKKVEVEETDSKELMINNEFDSDIKEIIVEKKAGFNYAEVIVIMLITLILGGITGSFFTFIIKGEKCEKKIIYRTDNNEEVPEELNEFLNTYNNIINDYYEEVDHKALLEAGINGMLRYLGDDYSVYMNPEEAKSFDEQVEGKYQGIGVEIVLQENGDVTVNRIFEGSPASKTDLKVGDIFLEINGEDVTDLNPSQVASKIRNSGLDKATIVVSRDGEKKTFTMKLDTVDLESVETKTFERNNQKVGYIYLSVFASNSYKQFDKALEKLEKEGIDSLIIDLRGNSGGYLNIVTDIGSLFLDKNSVIYQLDTKGVVEKVYSNSKEKRTYKIVVLVDRGSASASEILAGALQESYGATVIGTNSFGKGTVQTAYHLSSGSTVKYTIQKWLTPNGNWINGTGITPDIEVLLDEEYANNPCDETDKQLQAAIDELTK